MTDKKTAALKQALEALQSNELLVNGDDKNGGLAWCLDGYYAGCFDIETVNKQTKEAITALCAALADQPAQHEPVAWRSWNDHDGYGFWETKQEAEPWCAPDFFAEPLYTSPPASKPWVGLTPEDRYQAIRQLYCDDATAALAACHSNDEYEAIEAKLKEKNA